MSGNVDEDSIAELVHLLDAALLFAYGEGSEDYVKGKNELDGLRRALLEGNTKEKLEALRKIQQLMVLPIMRLRVLGADLSLITESTGLLGQVVVHYDFSFLAGLASFSPEELRELYPDEGEREEVTSRISDIADDLPRISGEEMSMDENYSIDLVIGGRGSQLRAFSDLRGKLDKLSSLED